MPSHNQVGLMALSGEPPTTFGFKTANCRSDSGVSQDQLPAKLRFCSLGYGAIELFINVRIARAPDLIERFLDAGIETSHP
jgi:hypothetical protein